MSQEISYKPSSWYFRQALRATDDPETLRAVGLCVVSELEMLKEWVRAQGLIPPKNCILRAEAEEKGWPVD